MNAAQLALTEQLGNLELLQALLHSENKQLNQWELIKLLHQLKYQLEDMPLLIYQLME